MKKILMIIGGIVVGAALLFVVLFFIVSATSDKIVCKGDKSKLTIMYKDNKIKGYTAKNIDFDQDTAQAFVDIYGIESYYQTLDTWFEDNVNGSCTMKNK